MHPLEADTWSALKRQAITQVEQEPILSGHLYDLILRHRGYADALAYLIASSLSNQVFSLAGMNDLIGETITRHPEIASFSLDDLAAVTTRDPASECSLVPFLYYKGFKGLQAHRVAHALWTEGRKGVARFLQSRVADSLAIDIHPAARIGRGVFMDHGIGLVIGETSVVEDDVSILQSVTLGGTGKESGDRHPKGRNRQGVGRPAPQDPPRRDDRGGRQDPRQHRGGRRFQGGCGERRAEVRAAAHHRSRGSRRDRGRAPLGDAGLRHEAGHRPGLRAGPIAARRQADGEAYGSSAATNAVSFAPASHHARTAGRSRSASQ